MSAAPAQKDPSRCRCAELEAVGRGQHHPERVGVDEDDWVTF
jgi:hypothetical protein